MPVARSARRLAARLSLAVAAAPLHAQPARPALTLDRIFSGPSLTGTAPARPTWSPDGRTLAFTWDDRQRPARDLWIVAADGTARRALRPAGDTTPAGIGEFRWSPDGRTIHALARGRLVALDVATGARTTLATPGDDAHQLDGSPDGTLLSWLADGDLWIVPATGGTPRRLTNVARPFVGTVPLGTYARRDVEIGEGTWGGPTYAWSPDGRTIAVHHVDRRHVRRLQVPYYLGDTAIMNTLRRSVPGDTNEARRVGLVDVATGTLRLLDLRAPTDVRVVGFEWNARGTLLIDRESDDAIDRWLHLVDAGAATPRTVWHDRRDTRVYTDIGSTWHPDGRRIVVTTDRDDRYRLYALDPATGALAPLTPNTSDVLGGATAHARTRSLVYAANAPDPAERHLYRVAGTGGTPVRLTTRPGTHTGELSPDGRTLATIHSDDVTPPELWLVDVARGREQRVTTSPPAAFAQLGLVAPRYLRVRHRDDSTITLRVKLWVPQGLDPSRRHPLLLGPVYSNTVRNRWGGASGLVQQHLLARGYLVAQVDVRGSTGYGRAFREAFLMDWGGGDLTDLASAIDALVEQAPVDRARVGIYGSSYGGTLTVYGMLRRPELFAAGVAGAPATEPRWFGSDDVAIARRPATHPETFRRGRALPDAAGLRAPLLIIHGMQDDVVPFQTSVTLFDELLRLGKPVDFAFAPAATHGWSQRPAYARYLYGRLVEHFDRHLRPDGVRAP